MARVEIKNGDDGKAVIRFDGRDFSNEIVCIDSHISAKHRDFNVQIHGMPEIDFDGRIDFSFSPQTVEEAEKIMRHSFMTEMDMYNSLVGDIESALRESTVVWEEWEYTQTARKIADRVIGR